MKSYLLQFGSGDPRSFAGLAPTFVIFQNIGGSTVAPPGITEMPTSAGLYYFNWGTTTAIAFLADGATTGLASARYIVGQLDPADRADEYGTTLVAIGTSSTALGTTSVALGTTSVALGTSTIAFGTTIVAIGNTLLSLGYSGPLLPFIGSTASSFGSTSTDPVDLFGYMKRIQENLEGNSVFTKATGVWQILSRGSSTMLISKTIANGISTVTKT